MLSGCLATYDFRAVIDIKDQKIMCDASGKGKVADLRCKFKIKYKMAIFSCDVLLSSLHAGWTPIKDGAVVVGCDVMFDFGDVGEEKEDGAIL